MVSQEFKTTVAEKNLLRTRIMLKDSFVIDPTFAQLDEMLSYAKKNLPNLMVMYDGDYLEEERLKWTSETMNEELVQLVTNFSETRINHLKMVVSKVLAKEIEMISQKRSVQNVQSSQYSRSNSVRLSKNSMIGSSDFKDSKRKESVKKMSHAARKVPKILYEVDETKVWKSNNIDELERAAKEILKAVQEYRANK